MRNLFNNIFIVLDRFAMYSKAFMYITIGCLLILCSLLIWSFFSKKNTTKYYSFFIYFFLIGCGFIITELFLVQRLSVILGSPIVNNPIIFFLVLFFSGIGSFLSKKINLKKDILLKKILLLIGIITITMGLFMKDYWKFLYEISFFVRFLIVFLIIIIISILLGGISPQSLNVLSEEDKKIIPGFLASNTFGYIWGGFLFLFLAPNIGYSALIGFSGIIYLISFLIMEYMIL